MKILVTAGSRHGATTGIAEAIADELARQGHEATFLAPEAVGSTAGYDAAVIGSGVYAGRWVGSAKQLVEREAANLRSRPVWLFSSGPLGDPPVPNEEPADAAAMIAASGARGHRAFAGLIDRSKLGFGERALVRIVKAPDGDFRPWDEIRAWAAAIATELTDGAPASAGAPAAVGAPLTATGTPLVTDDAGASPSSTSR